MEQIKYELFPVPEGGAQLIIRSLANPQKFASFPLTAQQCSRMAAELMIASIPVNGDTAEHPTIAGHRL